MHVLAEKAHPRPVDQQPIGVACPAQRLHQRRAQGHAQVLGGQFVGRRHAQVLARHGNARGVAAQGHGQGAALQLGLDLGEQFLLQVQLRQAKPRRVMVVHAQQVHVGGGHAAHVGEAFGNRRQAVAPGVQGDLADVGAKGHQLLPAGGQQKGRRLVGRRNHPRAAALAREQQALCHQGAQRHAHRGARHAMQRLQLLHRGNGAAHGPGARGHLAAEQPRQLQVQLVPALLRGRCGGVGGHGGNKVSIQCFYFHTKRQP